jgi:hypothetical protein
MNFLLLLISTFSGHSLVDQVNCFACGCSDFRAFNFFFDWLQRLEKLLHQPVRFTIFDLCHLFVPIKLELLDFLSLVSSEIQNQVRALGGSCFLNKALVVLEADNDCRNVVECFLVDTLVQEHVYRRTTSLVD